MSSSQQALLGVFPYERLLQEILSLLEKSIHPSLKVYTIQQVSEILQCDESTVKNLIFRTKELRACKIGKKDPIRILHSDLLDFLVNRRNPCLFDKVLK